MNVSTLLNVNQYILQALYNEKINYIFCVPGGWIDPFLYEVINDGRLTPVIAAHEAGAAYMADGYARSSKRFGVCACLGGPGLTNTVTAIATAKTDLSPLLIISGETDTHQQGRGAFQDSTSYGLDSQDMLRSLTNMQLRIDNPVQIVKNFERLLRKMLGHHGRGPVHLSLPSDVQEMEVSKNAKPDALPELIYQPRFVDQKAALEASRLMQVSANIVILAGAGVRHSGANKRLIEFAEKFSIPVATTLGGKGVIPDDHPLSLGMLGWFGHRHASQAILKDEVDVLIVLGSRLNQFDTVGWTPDFKPKKYLILNDIVTDSAFRNFHVDFPVLGDTLSLLDEWLALPAAQTKALSDTIKTRQKWLESIRKSGSFYFDEENCTGDITPIHPARAIRALRQTMPNDTVFYTDSGAHSFFAAHYCPVSEPTQYVSSLKYMGAMGWAIPACIGAKLARPDLPHVLITGDGCMLMHGIEIQTAARYNLPIIFVVINNSALGNPLLRSEKMSAKHAALDILPTHDWAKFAEALGVTGFSVKNPAELIPTFEKALALKKAVLIDITTGNYPTPTHVFDDYYTKKKSYLL